MRVLEVAIVYQIHRLGSSALFRLQREAEEQLLGVLHGSRLRRPHHAV